MKLIYCLMIFLLPLMSIGQTSRPLSIGEKVPDVVLNNIVNYKTDAAKLSDFKGKLVILDFMHTSCRSCLLNLIRFDSLQKLYKKQVQFLIVTTQKKGSVNSFLKNSTVGKKINLPFITEDKTLQAIFPFTYISHIVWIGADGVVKAITHGDYVTAGNLSFIAKGGINHWPVKLDEPDFDYEKPLLVLNPQIQNLGNFPVRGSFMFPYLPEVAQYFLVKKDAVSQTVRTVFINQPITEMYLRLMGKIRFPHSQIILKVKDSSRFIFDSKKFYRREWDEKNRWCYESLLPLSMNEEQRHSRIFKDIDFYFGIKGELDNKTLPCLILKPTAPSGNKPLKATDSLTLWAIINQLNNEYSGTPIFNSIPSTNRTWIAITHQQVANRDLLKKILLSYGFELVPEMRQTEVLTISETK